MFQNSAKQGEIIIYVHSYKSGSKVWTQHHWFCAETQVLVLRNQAWKVPGSPWSFKSTRNNDNNRKTPRVDFKEDEINILWLEMWQREEEILLFIFFTYNCESNEKDFTFVDFLYCTSILKMTLGPHPFLKIFTRDHDVAGLISNFYGSSTWPISQNT